MEMVGRQGHLRGPTGPIKLKQHAVLDQTLDQTNKETTRPDNLFWVAFDPDKITGMMIPCR